MTWPDDPVGGRSRRQYGRSSRPRPSEAPIASLIVLYTAPDDVDGFLDYYRESHVPIAQQLPGITSLSASRITGTPRGTEAAYFLKAEISFASTEDLMTALTGEQGMAVSRDAMGMTQRFGCSAEIMLAEDL